MKLHLFSRPIIVLTLATFSALGFGSVGSANAAPLADATATSSTQIGSSGTNASAITISATSVTGAPANMFNVDLPSGWSFVSPAGSCSNITLTGFTGSPSCQTINFGPTTGFATIQVPTSAPFTVGQALSVTFAANTMNVSAARSFTVDLANSSAGGASVDNGIAVLAGGGATQSTVTFNANGGTGAMADQAASASSPLTTNVFTRSGYTFAGWNTAVNGSGTAYADGASYPFTANTTLYAQWTAVLANTGVDAAGFIGTATFMFILGATLIAYRATSRKKSQKS